jgi:hypothetical protein
MTSIITVLQLSIFKLSALNLFAFFLLCFSFYWHGTLLSLLDPTSEVNKVAKPTNLVGRKLCGSVGLTENISWKSRIIFYGFVLIISKLFSLSQKVSVKFYICVFSAF